ncbi:MAG: 1-acyl-sn-glycerol-3-phosphate acyltransferase [Proteobacteria bacterium]|nr:1-acyl-sn-glycerol-3-phosphate acyltransferase [Pseudomonadota bacterium]
MSGNGDDPGARVLPFPVEPEAREDDVTDESLAAVREALDDLRREIRTRFPAPADGPSLRANPLEEFDPVALIEELRQRINAIGRSSRTGQVDEFGMDDAALERARPLLDFLLESYWRIDVRGLDGLALDAPTLFVANRSGFLPYDGLMLAHAIHRAHPDAPRPRFLVADWLITQPFLQPLITRLGGVRACRENAERLLQSGRSVVAFPEGVKGAAKVFRDRYRLKRFARGGVIRVALENRVPLVPVGVVGAEEAHPILFRSGLAGRLLGLPFLPVTPTFPWLGPLGALPLPTKWVLLFGDALDLGERREADAADALLVSRLTEELRGRIQSLVDRGLAMRPSVWGETG